ncbi:hypothetical protein BGZ90_006229, partial [Linnemannia elongata]
ELEIDWAVCYSISEMMLQDAQELFRETEGMDNNNNGGHQRSSKGWWGEDAIGKIGQMWFGTATLMETLVQVVMGLPSPVMDGMITLAATARVRTT